MKVIIIFAIIALACPIYGQVGYEVKKTEKRGISGFGGGLGYGGLGYGGLGYGGYGHGSLGSSGYSLGHGISAGPAYSHASFSAPQSHGYSLPSYSAPLGLGHSGGFGGYGHGLGRGLGGGYPHGW